EIRTVERKEVERPQVDSARPSPAQVQPGEIWTPVGIAGYKLAVEHRGFCRQLVQQQCDGGDPARHPHLRRHGGRRLSSHGMAHVPRQLSCNTAQECVAALSTSAQRSLSSNAVAALTGTFVTPENAHAHKRMLR